MKLRINGNSLRIRLSEAELEAFAGSGRVADRVEFAAGAVLSYALVRDAGAAAMRAIFQDGAIEIQVPEATAREWCSSGDVTLTAAQPTPAGELRLLVEKDLDG